MAFLGSLDIVGSALSAERTRMDVTLQNISNAHTTRTEDGTPYRRQQVVFEERELNFETALTQAQANASGAGGAARTQTTGGVRVAEVVESDRDFLSVYDPTHPDADENGYVQYPNVDTTEEMLDMMTASNAYSTNLTLLSVMKAMINKTLEAGK